MFKLLHARARLISTILLIQILPALCNPATQPTPTSQSPSGRYPEHERSWVTGSYRRGTLDILFPCILTLLLCAWTAVHSNIEPAFWRARYYRYLIEHKQDEYDLKEGTSPEDAPVQSTDTTQGPSSVWAMFPARLCRGLNTNKLMWSIITLLFPEISLLVAAHERKTARMLTKEMQEAVKPQRDSREWDIILSYYAIMGGFVVLERPPDDLSEKTEINGDSNSGPKLIPAKIDTALETIRQKVTLTPRGVLQVAQLGYLNYPSSQAVKDKSKVNRLAKFLVVVQAIWTIAQVISRYITRLPVSLLELYTVLHTVCAVVMYVVWIDKPVDITQPTFVEVPEHIMKIMTKKGRVPNDVFREDNIPDFHNQTEVFWHGEGTPCLTRQAGLGKILFRQLWNSSVSQKRGIMGLFIFLFTAFHSVLNGWTNFWAEEVGLSIVSVVHGCLHLVAWNYKFPSDTERRLWKISALLTAGSVVIFCFSMLVGILAQNLWKDLSGEQETPKQDDGGGWIAQDIEKIGMARVQRAKRLPGNRRIYTPAAQIFIVAYCTCSLLGILPCVVARLYLLVESFVSMRRLPYGTYDKIMWTDFVPHVG